MGATVVVVVDEVGDGDAEVTDECVEHCDVTTTRHRRTSETIKLFLTRFLEIKVDTSLGDTVYYFQNGHHLNVMLSIKS